MKNKYWVDFYRNGICYRSTYDCSYEDVKRFKRTAKICGEEIKYEKFNN